MSTYVHVCMRTCLNMYVQSHTCACSPIHTCTHSHILTQCTLTCMWTCSHMHTYTIHIHKRYVYILMHIFTCMCTITSHVCTMHTLTMHTLTHVHTHKTPVGINVHTCMYSHAPTHTYTWTMALMGPRVKDKILRDLPLPCLCSVSGTLVPPLLLSQRHASPPRPYHLLSLF